MEVKLNNARLCGQKELEGLLDGLVKKWFFSRFPEFSMTQLYGVMPIHCRKNILISAPTGGTKTLTAFLSILNYLVSLARKKELEEKVYAVYCSPLKALSNDIYVNLLRPLEEIREIAKKEGVELQEIRVGLRTGDTTTRDRQKMLTRPPHVLVTTPETLAIILNSVKFSNYFKALEFIIVDEIHALANKRGVHLSLSLERLEEMSVISPVRVGLSATVSPLEEVAKFLVGVGEEKSCEVADVNFDKKFDVLVLSPLKDLIDVRPEEIQERMYELIDNLVQEHKTTLIFTNTRAATERVVHHLREKYPLNYTENIGAHHSSLSREYRFKIEQELREGKLKVVVTSTSLELGIDIGYIDLVILLGSPKASSRALQRIGRAGHKMHEVAKGRFIVLDRDDLVECSVLLKESIERKIDNIRIPKNCLDVLSQQIYGMVIYKVWEINELFKLIKKSYCYSGLSREDFLDVISYLSGEYALESRNIYAKIWYDRETGQIGKRGKLARVIYMTNIGTIPEESFIDVVISAGERRNERIGMVDEAFLERLKPGDVFVLGGRRYEFLYTRGMKAYVRGGVSKAPTIPSWFSEMLPLSFDSALEVGRFRRLMAEKFEKKKNNQEIIGFIKEYLYIGENEAKIIYEYFKEQYDFSEIPHDRRLLIECFHECRRYFAVFQGVYGRKVNDALSRALAYLVAKNGGRDVEIGISDNGFYLSGFNQMQIEKAFNFLNSGNLREILQDAIEKTEILGRRFRHCAARSLMILRNYKGRRKSVGRQQVSSYLMLVLVKKLSKNFPILREARREVLEDLMDVETAKKVLNWIKEGKIDVKRVELDIPSPFSLNLIMQAHSDLLKIEDKINFLKRMHKLHIGEKA
ncbi:ATP-dependent helicase [Candidatus Woesearchaeota archaeon CG10_big_fil_rev_8_21_14_0_10_34_12]|nr:MAG: ATP-dependent helicase [Candidatus Woesearchaeota archaeon CG10_big_fil_rev_8_21_14_0_10_34_12]